MSFWKIFITLKEPFCCSTKPLEGNETLSLPYIPATTLRGAAAWKLAMEGHGDSLGAMLGPGGPRWAPAWPLSTDPDRETLIPMPQCYATEKSGTLPGIRNRFDDGMQYQWKSLKKPFCAIDNAGQPLGEYMPLCSVKMRNSLDYQRQASRGAELYARGEIQEGTCFAAWLETEGNLPHVAALNGEVMMGKRRSSGSGLADWKIVEPAEDEFPSWRQPPHPDKHVRLQLMTDSIVPGLYGALECGFFPAMLAAAMQVDAKCVTEVRAYSSYGPVFGWSQAWGLPREQAIGIRAGSVCEFQFCGGDQDLRDKALDRLRQGIGIRRVEGFGIVAVQPNWLYESSAVDPAEADEDFDAPPRAIPGLDLPENALIALRASLSRLPAPPDDRNFDQVTRQFLLRAADSLDRARQAGSPAAGRRKR